MKKTVFILIATATLLQLNSCDPLRCDEVFCDDRRALYFLSKTDSTDLILGGAYALDSLHISLIRIDTTKPGARTLFGYSSSGSYNNVLIWPDKNTSGYIIQLDTLPPDTLMATTLQTESGECCPGFPIFESLTLNGDSISIGQIFETIKIFK